MDGGGYWGAAHNRFAETQKISILGGFVVDILAGCVIITKWRILFV